MVIIPLLFEQILGTRICRKRFTHVGRRSHEKMEQMRHIKREVLCSFHKFQLNLPRKPRWAASLRQRGRNRRRVGGSSPNNPSVTPWLNYSNIARSEHRLCATFHSKGEVTCKKNFDMKSHVSVRAGNWLAYSFQLHPSSTVTLKELQPALLNGC